MELKYNFENRKSLALSIQDNLVYNGFEGNIAKTAWDTSKCFDNIVSKDDRESIVTDMIKKMIKTKITPNSSDNELPMIIADYFEDKNKTTNDKIRYALSNGITKAIIYKKLNIKYQRVVNVEKSMKK